MAPADVVVGHGVPRWIPAVVQGPIRREGGGGGEEGEGEDGAGGEDGEDGEGERTDVCYGERCVDMAVLQVGELRWMDLWWRLGRSPFQSRPAHCQGCLLGWSPYCRVVLQPTRSSPAAACCTSSGGA